ncbi:hypothetical protein MBT84_00890 [Streptomyces sp. MBT84]|nr:hypothetical protein [Streptomyces sp. MBT84]
MIDFEKRVNRVFNPDLSPLVREPPAAPSVAGDLPGKLRLCRTGVAPALGSVAHG